MAPPKKRTRYSPYVKEQVRQRYRFCRTTADKEALAAELEILDDDGRPSVAKLYNLASRLGAAGSDEGAAGEFQPGHERPVIVEHPDETEFSRRDDEYLRNEFGRREIDVIAYHLHHSEPAVLYRARHLGLRKPVKHWRIEKVAAWLSMDLDEFKRTAGKVGLDIHPLHNLEGKLMLEVVSTSSLGRWIKSKGVLAQLRKNGADEFFLRELLESLDDLVAGKTEFESCKFLSHGHVCMNPFTQASFGLFCTNNERYKAGEDPRCSVRTLAIEDLRFDE